MASVGFVIVLSIAFTIAFAYCVALVDIEAMKADWERRRCEVTTMMVAGLAKPSSDPRSVTEFASDNFKYCMGKMAQDTLKVALAPMYTVAEQQANSVKNMNGVLNNVRGTLSSRKSWWDRIFSEKYGTGKRIGLHMYYTFQRLGYVFGRINAIFTSLVYAGISGTALVNNMANFTFDLFDKAADTLIPMAILPILPVFLRTISALGIPIRAALDNDAVKPAFCIDPDAKIVLANGTTKKLKEIQCGDQLGGARGPKNIVRGILEADARDTTLVRIRGVLMSLDHRVLHGTRWILAGLHPEAVSTDLRIERLICLNTTTHEVPIVDANGNLIWASDWEEIDTIDGQHEWIEYVNRILNPGVQEIEKMPTAVPLVSPTVCVVKKGDGPVAIESIHIGDEVLAGSTYTRVLGTYKGTIDAEEEPVDPEWISDGVWAKLSSGQWAVGNGVTHMRNGTSLDGHFLITESETFTIQRQDKQLLVRDFTELGASRMEEAYEWLDGAINRK
jgi:hypothetical protein